jgi:hypothetical protein
LKLTVAKQVKFVPISVTLIPTWALVGAKLAIVGALVDSGTLKVLAVVEVPPVVVTLIGPLVAQSGTVAVIEVEELKVTVVALTPLKLTIVGLLNFVPVMLTVVPAAPLAGEKLVIVGILEMSCKSNFVTKASDIRLAMSGQLWQLACREFTTGKPLNCGVSGL